MENKIEGKMMSELMMDLVDELNAAFKGRFGGYDGFDDDAFHKAVWILDRHEMGTNANAEALVEAWRQSKIREKLGK